MNKKTLVVLAAALGILFILYISLQEDHSVYIQAIQKERADKNRQFKFSAESPLTDSLKRSFDSLIYFPVNPKLKIKALLELLPSSETVYMPTSDGKEKRYKKFAKARFALQGQEAEVLLFKAEDSGANDLFFPFADETSAMSTYGGGRYIDLVQDNDRTIVIDFNKAYNPYCAYNPTYSCPIPPKENRLPFAIEAGEKFSEKP
ncbi:DUF1684 domain-containing protein [Cytophagales bacterium LB-30]|uniref:DUF1684 domain-containing protein n=1 Tax=Shiella aurantiaca TaxID=3058365 RepID=A0ABT8F3K0_9BACT|nr:DUF1684 domain-containing protein [Shiella aurantiaca]MDN4164849.1 DUF1684 domain-containing protein [Shiella aurantiaca]